MNPYIAASISVLSLAAGALLQFWLSRRNTDWSRLQEKRVQAYVDFLKGIAGVAQALRFDDKKAEHDSSALVADARARIAVYGHSQVISALAAFCRTDQHLMSTDTCKVFIQLIQTMRQVSKVASISIDDNELYLVLFG
jgi:Uri superfamily endonuclease